MPALWRRYGAFLLIIKWWRSPMKVAISQGAHAGSVADRQPLTNNSE